MREKAALLCAMMASSDAESSACAAVDFEDACGFEVCYADSGPADLARSAYWAAALHWHPEERAGWAEAEAMLRTGWSP